MSIYICVYMYTDEQIHECIHIHTYINILTYTYTYINIER